jgi:hypothetical protein
MGELKPKSILDGVKVEDKAFPLRDKLPTNEECAPKGMEIVSDCPDCGGPIYGHRRLEPGAGFATVVFSCTCRNKSRVEGQPFPYHTK